MKADMIALLNSLVANQVWWNTPPAGVPVDGVFIILQRTGGKRHWYIDMTRPDTAHGRVQVRVWGKDEVAVENVTKEVEATLAGSVEAGIFKAVTPYGSPIDDYNEASELHGTIQQFGVSYLNL